MSARQFYFTVLVFSISMRVQKMPTIMVSYLGKDSYLLVLLYYLVSFVLICLAFFVLKCMKLYKEASKNSNLSKFFKGLLLFFVSLYFIFLSTLLYESIQDLFAHVLFDNISWNLFSILLVVALFYMSLSGLKSIGRLMEMYFFVIIMSYFVIAIFGGMQTDFSAILPFETINFAKIFNEYMPFNIWFGDFMLILFLGNRSEGIKLKWTLLVYFISMVFTVLVTIEFYGIYDVYAAIQSSLISVITEMSMLGIDVGRVDWFLILFSEMGTIVCSGLCLCLAKECLSESMPKIKPNYILFVISVLLYLIDTRILVDTNAKEIVFLEILSYYAFYLKIIIFASILLVSIVSWFKYRKRRSGELDLFGQSLQEKREVPAFSDSATMLAGSSHNEGSSGEFQKTNNINLQEKLNEKKRKTKNKAVIK